MNFLGSRCSMSPNQLRNLLELRKLPVILFFICAMFFPLAAGAQTIFSNAVDFTLSDYLQQVLQHNNSIQAQMLEAESNRRKASGELGAFEPQFEASMMHELNKRT